MLLIVVSTGASGASSGCVRWKMRKRTPVPPAGAHRVRPVRGPALKLKPRSRVGRRRHRSVLAVGDRECTNRIDSRELLLGGGGAWWCPPLQATMNVCPSARE